MDDEPDFEICLKCTRMDLPICSCKYNEFLKKLIKESVTLGIKTYEKKKNKKAGKKKKLTTTKPNTTTDTGKGSDEDDTGSKP